MRKSDAKRPDDGGKYEVLDLAIFMSFLQGENIRDFYYKLAINNIPPIASTGWGCALLRNVQSIRERVI